LFARLGCRRLSVASFVSSRRFCFSLLGNGTTRMNGDINQAWPWELEWVPSFSPTTFSLESSPWPLRFFPIIKHTTKLGNELKNLTNVSSLHRAYISSFHLRLTFCWVWLTPSSTRCGPWVWQWTTGVGLPIFTASGQPIPTFIQLY
jgi:hypothetical protein